MSTSLEMLRTQINDIDQTIIQSLSQWGEEEDCLDTVSVLTDEDKEILRSTRLHFSQKVCELLQERMQISAHIGRVKYSEWRTSMIDENRKKQLLQSRVEWASEHLKKSVEELYEIIHDISVKIQLEMLQNSV